MHIFRILVTLILFLSINCFAKKTDCSPETIQAESCKTNLDYTYLTEKSGPYPSSPGLCTYTFEILYSGTGKGELFSGGCGIYSNSERGILNKGELQKREVQVRSACGSVVTLAVKSLTMSNKICSATHIKYQTDVLPENIGHEISRTTTDTDTDTDTDTRLTVFGELAPKDCQNGIYNKARFSETFIYRNLLVFQEQTCCVANDSLSQQPCFFWQGYPFCQIKAFNPYNSNKSYLDPNKVIKKEGVNAGFYVEEGEENNYKIPACRVTQSRELEIFRRTNTRFPPPIPQPDPLFQFR